MVDYNTKYEVGDLAFQWINHEGSLFLRKFVSYHDLHYFKQR